MALKIKLALLRLYYTFIHSLFMFLATGAFSAQRKRLMSIFFNIKSLKQFIICSCNQFNKRISVENKTLLVSVAFGSDNHENLMQILITKCTKWHDIELFVKTKIPRTDVCSARWDEVRIVRKKLLVARNANNSFSAAIQITLQDIFTTSQQNKSSSMKMKC